MLKVKTYIESLREGYQSALRSLDNYVEELGDIKIMDIRDSVLPDACSPDQKGASYLERIIVYQDTNISKGELWKPNLDTDLMKFLKATDPPGGVWKIVEEARLNGKKTIRELIAMPYTWFHGIDAIEEYANGKENWDLLRRELNRYGFKLYKKGNVIKD